MRKPTNFDVPTPPASPTENDLSDYFRHEVWQAASNPVSCEIITPPITPSKDKFTQSSAVEPRAAAQLDGNEEDYVQPTAGGLLERDGTPDPLPSYNGAQDIHAPLASSSDISSVDIASFPTPKLQDPHTPRRASQYSHQSRIIVPLSPLALRKTRPQSLPGVRSPANIISGKRRLSGTYDRFIAVTTPTRSINECFRLCKAPERLSYHERIHRRCPSGQDPFTPESSRYTPPNNSLNTSSTTGNIDVARTATIVPPHSLLDPGIRRPRQGTQRSVWTVSGASTSVDRNGGRLSSGTNAPFYNARFHSNLDQAQELESFERRLALALEIDQSSRVLSTLDALGRDRPKVQDNSHQDGRSRISPFQSNGMSVWRNSEWTKTEALHCEFCEVELISGVR